MRRFCLLAAIVAAALAAAGPAAALAPTTTTAGPIHRSIDNFLTCPGFVVHGEFDITRTTTTFYDQDGAIVRVVVKIDATGTLSNPLTGRTLADAGSFMITLDPAAGTATYTGKLRVDTAPGEGVVFEEVGRVVIAQGTTVFTAGQFDDPPPASGLAPDLEALCGYLAGS